MAAIDPQVLLEEAKCYACFAQASLPELLKLALLARISEGGGSGGSGTPGGANGQVQFNNAGAFGGDAGLTYNSATDTLTVGVAIGSISIGGGAITNVNTFSSGDITATNTLTGPTVTTSIAYTVATLPAAGVAGRRAYVTNSLAPAFGAAVAGGGAVVIPVFDNGTTWIVG